jgi:hypothetical protein
MHRLHPYFHDDVPIKLDEETYKSLIRDITNNNVPGEIVHNLPHRDWAPLIKHVKYVEREQNIFKFFVPNKYNGWETYVQFSEWDDVVGDITYNPVDSARLLIWSGNLRLHCPCPSYKFWGYQYLLTQKEAAIIPEDRFPTIRNPNLQGVCCKHLRRVMKVLPFQSGKIAAEIKKAREDSFV